MLKSRHKQKIISILTHAYVVVYVIPQSSDCNLQKQPYRGVLRKWCSEICSKFTGKHPCRSVISIKLQRNFIEITPRHG